VTFAQYYRLVPFGKAAAFHMGEVYGTSQPWGGGPLRGMGVEHAKRI